MTNSDNYIDDKLKENSGELEKIKEQDEIERARKANEKLDKAKKTKVELTDRIKSIILYVGMMAAIISGVAYINITIVLINGFETSLEFESQILFSIIGVIVGLSISTMLRLQGIAFAKKNQFAYDSMKKYYAVLNKTKSIKNLHDIKYYLIRATILDVIIKGIIVAVTTWFILDLTTKGNGDWELLKLAFANLGLFTGFGLIALSGAFDKYLDEHIPVIIEKTKKLEKQIEQKEKEEKRLLEQKAKQKPKTTPKAKPKPKPKKKTTTKKKTVKGKKIN